MTAVLTSSATGILALLEEQDDTLKVHALKKLNVIVDQYWAEVADAIPLIESLSEDEDFSDRELAALLASKCFFHLEEYEDALRLALGAGPYFDLQSKSPYTETIISTCIDAYASARAKEMGSDDTLDPRIKDVVEQMFERCYATKEFNQALGIALDTRRLDHVKECFQRCDNVLDTLAYCFEICRTIVQNREFRYKVYQVIVETYRAHPVQEYSSICQCLQVLDKHADVTEILDKLIRGSVDDSLVAYQVAFDLSENENQKFLMNIHDALPSPPKAASVLNANAAEGETKAEGQEDAMDCSMNPSEEAMSDSDPVQNEYWKRIEKLKSILSGDFMVDLSLDFLHRKSDTDPLTMQAIKTAVEKRSSVLHHAAVIAHAYINCGTTDDHFLRENLEWLGKATNWAKFTATATLGVVHKGHVRESMNLLAPYLPTGGASVSPFSEGGALYAMGLVHANKGLGGAGSKDTMDYLRNALKNSGTSDIVQHGACLGIGLCGLACHDYEIYEELKNVVFTDSAVAGEAAGIAIGLVLLGTGGDYRNGEILRDLLGYAHDTRHEKIIRGIAMGLALMMYGREEHADGYIEQLVRDKDPIIRYGGMYAIAMAYCGTSSNNAVRQLLHVAVSDVSDDVRRAAVTCLGFVLFRNPAQVPRLVSLLAESFNPHVRYGACMAVGIACAGTAKNEALQLLGSLLNDAVDYVRQGALLAMSMVLMQESEGRTPKVASLREQIQKYVSEKHVATMTKMGAIMAQGILDAGGRNVVISLQSHTGFTKMSAVVGLAIWTQHWFWYPLLNFIELSFQPTFAIGLNKDFKIPKAFSVHCKCKKSMFAPPKHAEEKREEKKEMVATAVLSTTAKAKARQAKHDKKIEGAKGEARLDTKKIKDEKVIEAVQEPEAMDVDEEGPAEATGASKKEPSNYILSVPARIPLAQEAYISFDMTQRYVPIMPTRRPAGIIMLRDTKPDQEEDVEQVRAPTGPGIEEEAEPPQPFEWKPT